MWRFATSALLVACAAVPGPHELALDTIEPTSGLNTKTTPVMLHGSFAYTLTSNLDRGTTASLDSVTVSIGPTQLADAAWRDETLLDATVPDGLTAGTYDVTVSMGMRIAVLPEGYEVLEAQVQPLGPFGTPTLVTALSSPATEDDPSMTDDRLELYFNSDRPGGLGQSDIWVTTRASTADPWGAPVLASAVNTIDYETTPKISPDGLTLYFASDRAGGMGNYDIYMTTRTSRASAWSSPVHVPELSSSSSDSGANPNRTQLLVVLSSSRNGGGDVFVASRASTSDPWGTPVPLAEANSADGDADPMIAAQDLTLVFISARPGGMGGNDIYLAERMSASVPFGAPAVLAELNSAFQEEDPWISDDLRHIMFTSARGGDFEIYEALR